MAQNLSRRYHDYSEIIHRHRTYKERPIQLQTFSGRRLRHQEFTGNLLRHRSCARRLLEWVGKTTQRQVQLCFRLNCSNSTGTSKKYRVFVSITIKLSSKVLQDKTKIYFQECNTQIGWSQSREYFLQKAKKKIQVNPNGLNSMMVLTINESHKIFSLCQKDTKALFNKQESFKKQCHVVKKTNFKLQR